MPTTLLGIIGDPVNHSLSPEIHNALSEHYKADALYIPIKIPASKIQIVPDIIDALGLKGFNVTMPHKRSIIPYLNTVSDTVRQTNSCNTVVVADGKLIGHSTDGSGLIMDFASQDIQIENKNVVLLGVGGVSAPVGIQLISKGAKLTIVGRSNENLTLTKSIIESATKKTVTTMTWDKIVTACASASVIINATPLGMLNHDNFESFTFLNNVMKDAVVYDMIYTPNPTKLLSEAKKLSLRTFSGIGMLIGQAILAYEMFTGIAPEKNAIQAVYTRLKKYIS